VHDDSEVPFAARKVSVAHNDLRIMRRTQRFIGRFKSGREMAKTSANIRMESKNMPQSLIGKDDRTEQRLELSHTGSVAEMAIVRPQDAMCA